MSSKIHVVRYIIIITFILLFSMVNKETNAEPLASLYGGQLFLAEYARDPSIYSGTFDFSIDSMSGTYGATGFLNVVADIDGSPGISDNEWVLKNVPVNMGDGLLNSPVISAWFDPGTLDIYPDTVYNTWAVIDENEISSFGGYTDWYYSSSAAGSSVWGSEDSEGQAGCPSPAPSQATASGKESYSRSGVPDIEQKPKECGPTSTANSLRWLAKEHNFNEKLPKNDDDLIKELMKAMTGSDTRPFSGLKDNELYDGKVKYIKDKKLPLYVKGGNTDPNAVGGKAFDFIKSELKAEEDVEFLIDWPDPNAGSHWVTVVGYGVNGDRLFLNVHDPDDKKNGVAIWELDKNGVFKSPRGTAMWAVSESPVPEPSTCMLLLFGFAGIAAIKKRFKV